MKLKSLTAFTYFMLLIILFGGTLLLAGTIQNALGAPGLKVIVHADKAGTVCVYSQNEDLGCKSSSGPGNINFIFSDEGAKTGEEFTACLNEICKNGTNSPGKRPEDVYFTSDTEANKSNDNAITTTNVTDFQANQESENASETVGPGIISKNVSGTVVKNPDNIIVDINKAVVKNNPKGKLPPLDVHCAAAGQYIKPEITIESVKANSPELGLQDTILEGRPIVAKVKIHNLNPQVPISGNLVGNDPDGKKHLQHVTVQPYQYLTGIDVPLIAPMAGDQILLGVTYVDECEPSGVEFGQRPTAVGQKATDIAAQYYVLFDHLYVEEARSPFADTISVGFGAKSINKYQNEDLTGSALGDFGDHSYPPVHLILGPFNLVPNDQTRLGINFVADNRGDGSAADAVKRAGALSQASLGYATKIVESDSARKVLAGLSQYIGYGLQFINLIESLAPGLWPGGCNGPVAGDYLVFNSRQLYGLTGGTTSYGLFSPKEYEIDLPNDKFGKGSYGPNGYAGYTGKPNFPVPPGIKVVYPSPTTGAVYQYYYSYESATGCGDSSLYGADLKIVRVPPGGVTLYGNFIPS